MALKILCYYLLSHVIARASKYKILHNMARHDLGSYGHTLKIFAALANVDTNSLFYTPYDSETQRLRTSASFQTVLEKVGQS